MQAHRLLLSVWLFVFGFCVTAQAAELLPYQGEVPVASYSPADWQKALAPALEQVLIKLSGNPKIAQKAAVRQAISKASKMVQTFSYLHHADASGKQSLVLRVRFSSSAVDNLLSDAGQLNAAEGDDVPSVAPADTGDVVEVPPPAQTQDQTQDQDTTSQNTAPQDTTPHTINMVVSGINGLKDYTALLDYVHHLSGVMDVSSKQTQGDRVLLLVKISGAAEAFAQRVEGENKLVKEQLAGVDPAATVLSYRWGSLDPPVLVSEQDAHKAGLSAASMKPSVSSSEQAGPATSSVPIVEGTPFVAANSVSSGNSMDSSRDEAETFPAPPPDDYSEWDSGVSP